MDGKDGLESDVLHSIPGLDTGWSIIPTSLVSLKSKVGPSKHIQRDPTLTATFG